MNGGYLLDTNVPSETLRPLPHAKMASWLERQPNDIQFLSVVTGSVNNWDSTTQCATRADQLTAAVVTLGWVNHYGPKYERCCLLVSYLHVSFLRFARELTLEQAHLV
jgi:hypothetical protein